MKKLITRIGMCIGGGFALLCYLNGDSSWKWWFLIFLAFAISAVYYTKKHPDEKIEQIPMVSILPEEAKKALDNGKLPKLDTESRQVAQDEDLCWVDLMRIDYYGSKPHTFYLSNKRFFCLDKEFPVSIPLENTHMEQTNRGIKITNGKQKLAFLTPSADELLKAWELVRNK